VTGRKKKKKRIAKDTEKIPPKKRKERNNLKDHNQMLGKKNEKIEMGWGGDNADSQHWAGSGSVEKNGGSQNPWKIEVVAPGKLQGEMVMSRKKWKTLFRWKAALPHQQWDEASSLLLFTQGCYETSSKVE